MAINLSTFPLVSTITQWFIAPSEDIADYSDGDIDDIILQGDVVLVLTTHTAYGDICGEVIEVDYEHELSYRVAYQIEGRWTARWYALEDIAKVY